MSRLQEIHNYLISMGMVVEGWDWDTEEGSLSEVIALYAHRNQKRENGDEYVNHPYRCAAMNKFSKKFYELLNISPLEIEILCNLHDVVEDTDFSLYDIKEIFEECGFGDFFNEKIFKQLDILTHKNDEEKDIYIKKCMEITSCSLVKFLDLYDNLNIFTLSSFEESKYKRCQNYLKYLYIINNKYHFIELMNQYNFISKNLNYYLYKYVEI